MQHTKEKGQSILRLRAERLRRGWSQQDLSFFARLSTADLSRIETARLRPYPPQLERLARVLGIEADRLLDEVEVEVGTALVAEKVENVRK